MNKQIQTSLPRPAGETTGQMRFFLDVLNKYRAVHPNPVGARRLDYWVTSTLPPHERLIFVKGAVVPYEHTKAFLRVMNRLSVQARIQGNVPFSWIKDDKNANLAWAEDLQEGSLDVSVPDLGPPILTLPDLQNWDVLVHTIQATSEITPSRFAFQENYLLVCIEKDPDEPDFRNLVAEFGADYQPFNGQPSLTRIHDAAERAKKRAGGQPVRCFYVSDMDPAGYQMPEAFEKRLNQIYPNPGNSVERIAITPAQHQALKLPPMISEKVYGKAKWATYFARTGFTEKVCSEIDALDSKFLCQVLTNAITPYAKLDADKEANTVLDADAKRTASDLNERIEAINFDEDKKEYEQLCAEAEQSREALENLQNRLEKIFARVNQKVENEKQNQEVE